MAIVLERPVEGHTTLEDALGAIFGKLGQLEQGQQSLLGGLEALAKAHGSFATKVLMILGEDPRDDQPAPPGIPGEMFERMRR